MKALIPFLGGLLTGFLLLMVALAVLAIAIDFETAREREALEKLRK